MLVTALLVQLHLYIAQAQTVITPTGDVSNTTSAPFSLGYNLQPKVPQYENQTGWLNVTSSIDFTGDFDVFRLLILSQQAPLFSNVSAHLM